MTRRLMVPSVARNALAALLALCLSSRTVTADPPRPAPLPEGLELKTPAIPKQVKNTLRKLNEALSKDVAPADNAVILLVPLFGHHAFEPELGDQALEMLGIQSLPQHIPEIVTSEEFVKAEGARTTPEIDIAKATLDSDLGAASERLWTGEEFPQLAKFLDENKEQLNILVQASEMPKFYVPMLSIESPPRLLSASLTIERRLPYLARMLTARAMLALQNGDVAAAQSDLLACHKLANLLASGSPFDVSGAKAHVMDAVAYQGERAMLQSGLLNGQQAHDYLKKLNALPPMPTSDIAANVGERAILHQEIELLKSDKASWEGYFEEFDAALKRNKKAPSRSGVNWEQAIAGGDEVQDRVVAALSERDHAKQNGLFDALDKEYQAWMEADENVAENLPQKLKEDPEGISRWIGSNMGWSLRTLYRQRRATDDRARARRDLIRIGLALLAYRGDHKEFPQSLEPLVPQYLPEHLLDPHSDQPWIYTLEGNGLARVITYGNNLRNDANQFYNDDQMIELK